MPEYHGGLLAARIFLEHWCNTSAMEDYLIDRKLRVLGMPPLPIEAALEAAFGKAFYEGADEEAAERDGLRT